MSLVYNLNRFNLPADIQVSIDAIYKQILSLVKSQGKSFNVTDIFSTISATVVAVNSFFTGTDTTTKITYVGEIVEQVISELSADSIIPSEVGFIVKLIPIKLIVEFIMHFVKTPVKLPELKDAHDVLPLLSVKNPSGTVEYGKTAAT